MDPIWPPGVPVFSAASAGAMNLVLMPEIHCHHEGARLAWSTMALQSHPCESGISCESPSGACKPKASFCPWLPQWEVPLDVAGQPPPAPGGVVVTLLSLWQKGQGILSSPISISAFNPSFSPRALGSSHSYSMVCTYIVRNPPFQVLTWMGATHPLEASAFEFKGVGEWQQN